MGGVDYLRKRAANEDEGRFGILILIADRLARQPWRHRRIAASARRPASAIPCSSRWRSSTILLSWAFIHVVFAVHYANEYYARAAQEDAGLTFPKDDAPDYWDFLYFSFVIGMTSQVSDVAVASKPVRRIVLAHGIVSFLFNVTLLALVVNIAASVI